MLNVLERGQLTPDQVEGLAVLHQEEVRQIGSLAVEYGNPEFEAVVAGLVLDTAHLLEAGGPTKFGDAVRVARWEVAERTQADIGIPPDAEVYDHAEILATQAHEKVAQQLGV